MANRALRRQLQPYVGKPIVIRHKNGRLYHGVLNSINDEGIMLRPLNPARMASMKVVQAEQDNSIIPAIAGKHDLTVDSTPVWWAAWFLIIFALILAFWGLGWGGGYGAGYGGYNNGAGYRGGWAW